MQIIMSIIWFTHHFWGRVCLYPLGKVSLVFVKYSPLHERGCDEYLLCFTTKYSVDRYKLEYHGHEPDRIEYFRDHIPQITKDLFQAAPRQR